MDSIDIVWEDPPDDRTSRGFVHRLAKQLRSRPNVWAKAIGPTSEGRVESLRSLLVYSPDDQIQRGEFECRRKKIDRSDDSSYCLWARYVGNGSEAEA